MKIIKIAAIIFIITDVVLLSLIMYESDILVNIKYALFTDYTKDKRLFNGYPLELVKSGFKIDAVENASKWYDKHANEIGYIQDIDKQMLNLSETEKAKKIALLFSKDSGNLCSNEVGLRKRLQELPKGGYGCCVDYSEAFVALSTLSGLFSRKVHTVVHVTDEFYSKELNKWVWIDPQHVIMAKGSNGEYLSLTELRDYYFRGEKVNYEFFGTGKHFLNNKSPYDFEYYDSKEDFSDIMITKGNNVFEEDNFYMIFGSLPKSIIQFIALSMGKQPSFLMFVDGNSVKNHNPFYKYFFISLVGFILLGNALCALRVFMLLSDRMRKKTKSSQLHM